MVMPSDTLAILINADPDSMASAMPLKRIFKNLVVILRNAGFRGDAGKKVRKIFGRWKGSAGGHRNPPGWKPHWKTYWLIVKTNPVLGPS